MKFDLIVIGGGPAGEKGAAQAAYFGYKVALIDNKDLLGGTVNESAFMVKYLREMSLLASSIKNKSFDEISVDFSKEVNLERAFLKTSELSKQIDTTASKNLLNKNIIRYHGKAEFFNKNEIIIKRNSGSIFNLKSKYFLICTGARQIIPPWFNPNNVNLFTSWNINKINRLPQDLTIIGGGMIGCEYASIFSYLGTKINLIHSRSNILGNLDEDISNCLLENLSKNKVNLILNERAAGIDSQDDIITIKFQSGNKIQSKMALIALGNKGNTKKLNLEAAGIEVDEKNYIKVNEKYQTSSSNIYAAGDVIGFPSLASTSMEQARLAVVYAFDLKYRDRLAVHFPKGVYTIPEIGYVGDNEKQLIDKKIDYVTGICRYDEIARGYLLGEELGFLKIMVDKASQKILGVVVVGKSATELIHFGALLVSKEMEVIDIIDVCFNFPSLHELYKYAAYDALGKLNKK